MKTEIKKKKTELLGFDPVKMMRDIRAKLTKEIIGMTDEEELDYLKILIEKGKAMTQTRLPNNI